MADPAALGAARAAMIDGLGAKARSDFATARGHFSRALGLVGAAPAADARELDLNVQILAERSAATLELALELNDISLVSRAEEDARAAILLDPGAAAGHGRLGEALLTRSQAEGERFGGLGPKASVTARIAFERAIALAPDSERWRRGLRAIPQRPRGKIGGMAGMTTAIMCGRLMRKTHTEDVSRAAAGPGPECRSCGVRPPPGEQLLRCGGCLQVFYCSEACQRAARKAHKPHCLAVKAQREAAASAGAGDTTD